MVNDIRNLVARTLPNHDRQYSKEQNVHQHDLAALRNHHDLLCTLFWASPPDLRPGIHNLEKLVIPASSHKEACLINLRAWNQLARFVAQEESSTSFVPLANWQTNVFKQLLDQYNSAASDIQQQFLAMSKDATSNISEAFMSSIVESNKAATMEIMLFSVKSSMDVVKYAGSLELARLASSTVQLQQVFQHFSTLPTDFPSALLQAALTTTERLIGRIERVFNEASGSQNSTSPQTLESEDAILMLERDLAAVFFSMSRCILSYQGASDGPCAKSISHACVEQSIIVSGMMTSLFVRCEMMRISHVFKHRKYRLFETVPNKLSMHQRTYLPLFLSTISQRGAEVNLTDIGIDILDLWLLIIVQPNHCLRYENQLGQCLQSQGWEFVPAKATGFVANPGYLSNRSLFEHVMGKMRQHLQCADAATKKNYAARFSKALDSVMLQMRADLQVVASQSPEHPTYVGFVRSIISLITTYGADIRAVHPFFKDVSKVYSPPAEDPQLQAATIQSYGLRLQEGDQRTASTLIHLFLNNFKQALRYGKLPEQVLLLRKAMDIDAIERFTVRMLSAVLHATLTCHEAYALLDVYCDALALAWAGSAITRPRSSDTVLAVVGLVTSILAWAAACRHFHPSFRLRKGPSESGADDGKPPDKPAGEQDDGNNSTDGSKIEPSTAPESAFRRPRSAFASARLRGSRQRPVDELPPVSLPQSFLEGNVSLYDPENRINTLTNDLWHHRYMGARWQDLLWKDLDGVFGHASWNEAKLQDALEGLHKGETEGVERRNRLLAEAAQWLSMSIDEMRSSNSLQSAREPLPTTEFADMLRYSNKFVLSNILSQHTRETKQNDPIPDQDVNDDGVLQSLVEQYIGEGQPKPRKDGLRLFDPRIRGEIVTAVRAELALKPDVSMAARELKRPLTVVSIPNYTGRSHSRKLMKHVASCAEADIIHLDAQDLGMLVGDYLGQDCAYSKGPISMLGYRAAEMNGRLAKAEEPQKPNDEDMAGEIEAAWVNIREHGIVGGYNNPMDEELQKIKDGAKDYVLPSVDRWENLKINAVLEGIADTATKLSTQPGRSLIIHVDDFVELNMTLEGALILGRLRAIVDTLWRSGKSVTLVGTSSNDNPSDQYASTLKEIAAEECLIPLPLNFHRITHASNTKKIYEANDYLQENLRNIQHMMKTIAGSSPDTSKLRVVGVSKSSPPQYLLDDAEGSYMEVSLIPPVLATSILPATDVYHVTRLFTVCRGAVPPEQSWRVLFDVVESSSYSTAQLHRLQDKPTRSKPPSSSTADNNQRAEPERLRVSGNYNDYEKKLLAGLVNSNEIKTTFDDVHADQETKSALKLLTSLSLVRPEAFTYGVLATDRIPGCLLYGPPGTGKTLLAKAVAKESGANMLEVSGASINDMYVGQSEKNVRALFSLAKKLSPLVIFIDEADALLAARGQRNRAAHRETINQFLREWDGMNDIKAFIMVATNRPFDLDDAVLRRLPRKILVDLPLKADRASILRILLKGENLDDSVSVDDIAAKTVLYSGSDLKNLCVAAAMTAVQEESEEAGKHTGPAPYVFPPKRTLRKHHFDKALKMIAASVSEDMDSLKSIRRFDEKYGDVRAKNSQKKKGMGFGVLPTAQDAEEARVRQAM
ncbi:Protein MSP1 [Colletotrichum orbiculare MAFF 240422]|uniref:Protein MSP1 n=1 Tax=Colletotrichum orbiculare (strain 104-T / ATCC 96160 / CBS 514.97 / LARS 414 / MAFF 240422) TaxID=1213857 RepID=A0A484G645_COLOR|nr:Protein MSP1 [Colletotrichum orbiculare MAFF 240422]